MLRQNVSFLVGCGSAGVFASSGAFLTRGLKLMSALPRSEVHTTGQNFNPITEGVHRMCECYGVTKPEPRWWR
jgi:hypothetical protein